MQTNLRLGSFAIVGAFIFTFSVQAGDQPQKARFVNLQPTELRCTKIDDVEGHDICSFEAPGVTILADGTLAARVTKGTLDYINGEGPVQGYTIETYADGSTLASKWSGISKVNDQNVRKIEGLYECASGTGRFSDIKCEGTYVSTVQKGGFHAGEYEGTMTLPN